MLRRKGSLCCRGWQLHQGCSAEMSHRMAIASLTEYKQASQVAQWKRVCLPLQETQETWVRSLNRKIPWKEKWQLTPVFWPGKSHGQRSLMGYSPWSCKESDMAKQLSMHKYCHQISWGRSRASPSLQS